MDTISTLNVNAPSPVKKRDSNLELYRIISMLLIIAHHYVVNSGLTSISGPIAADPTSWRSLFLLSFGAFGKTGINCFLFITGYFMCRSNITAKKFIKLFGEVVFYDVLLNCIFWLTGYAPFSLGSFITNILPFTKIAQNFTGCYIVFFLFIPFLNILIAKITQKQHLYLIFLCGFTYVFMGTIPFFSVTMNYVSWYIVLFFIVSYVRIYPSKFFEKTAFWGVCSLAFIILSICSVLACAWLGKKVDSFFPFLFVTDSNTLLALLTGFSSFMFFKNLKIKYNKIINLFASATFGVLLIHAAGDNMRKWLWVDVLGNVTMYNSKWMPLHAVLSVFAIFIVCAFIDLLRIKLIEGPAMRLFDRWYNNIKPRFSKIEDKVLAKLGVKKDTNK